MTLKRRNPSHAELLLGTLDMLVLQTLRLGAAHGYTIAQIIQRRSDEVLQVEQGSLYPALNRLEDRGWITSYWAASEPLPMPVCRRAAESRCTTVSGGTTIRAVCQSRHALASSTQNSRSRWRSGERLTVRLNTANC